MTASSPEIDRTTVVRARAEVGPVVSASCTLSVVQGPDAGKTFPIEDVGTRRILIGQSPACDVLLTDRGVSRRHAALEVHAGQLVLSDLDSTNGTSVNQLRIRSVYLRGGEVITLGGTTLRLDLASGTHVLPASTETSFHRVIGASPEMRRLYPVFKRFASADVPVLIEGETGTGKEVLAESIHEESTRKGGPFVVLDCTTLSSGLIESELFGHEKGAFTGADTARRGLFEAADGGTLFIDEIGDLDLSLQAKLLRVIEKSEVRRVGGSKWMRFNVRIIAATRRDLDREVQSRRFRDDLFFRLAVGRVELPPLRRRQGDVALLARCFWVSLGGDEAELPPSLLQRFEEYEWPGNIRELSNSVARFLALGEFTHQEDVVERTADTDFIDGIVKGEQPLPLARQAVLSEFEHRYVDHMLKKHGGNVGRAAAACGIGRRYFQMLRARG